MPTPTRVTSRFPLRHLRAWRLARFWSQTELAAQAGISVLTIVRLEHARSEANLQTVRKLAQALGIRPHTLAFAGPPDEEAMSEQ